MVHTGGRKAEWSGQRHCTGGAPGHNGGTALTTRGNGEGGWKENICSTRLLLHAEAKGRVSYRVPIFIQGVHLTVLTVAGRQEKIEYGSL